jgi:hypothetical protein
MEQGMGISNKAIVHLQAGTDVFLQVQAELTEV